MNSQPFKLVLPDELLFLIFQKILEVTQTLTAYETLRSCALVCKWWAPIASEVLLYWTELPTPDATGLLEKRLRRLVEVTPGKSCIKTLAFAARSAYDYDRLRRLLALDPGVRHLILCGGFNRDRVAATSLNLVDLQSLTDVSLLSTLHSQYVPHFLEAIIPVLPASLKFLSLPQFAPDISWFSDGMPAFSLYGLTVPTYPTVVTDWILKGSRDSLQSLTVSFNVNVIKLGENHPRLRSLKILDPWPHVHGNFTSLERLERLEVRWFIDAERPYGSDLPDSLQYYRFWGKYTAEDLNNLLADESRLPNLRIVAWDWWYSNAAAEADGMKVLERLKELCALRHVEVRTRRRETNLTQAAGNVCGPRTRQLSH